MALVSDEYFRNMREEDVMRRWSLPVEMPIIWGIDKGCQSISKLTVFPATRRRTVKPWFGWYIYPHVLIALIARTTVWTLG